MGMKAGRQKQGTRTFREVCRELECRGFTFDRIAKRGGSSHHIFRSADGTRRVTVVKRRGDCIGQALFAHILKVAGADRTGSKQCRAVG